MSKGRATEEKAMALYEQAGYEVYHPPKAKYREQDVFGVFDLLAFGHGQLVCVQCKTNRSDGITQWFEEARPYEEYLTDVTVEFLVRYEDAGWKLYRTDCDGYQVAYDGREIDAMPGPIIEEVLVP